MAWMPSFLNRYYDMATDKAGALAGVFILTGAIGMVLCGIITDRFAKNAPARKWQVAMCYSLLSGALLLAAFQLPAGPVQLLLIGAGMLLVGGTTGPAGAMVANLTPPAIHASAFATLSLANNLIGLAPGPFMTGVLADRMDLLSALQLAPLVCLLAAAAFAAGQRFYANDLRCMGASLN